MPEGKERACPLRVAATFEESSLAYAQLNSKANQLANYLIQTYDIKPDTLIALCLDRSEHILIAILSGIETKAQGSANNLIRIRLLSNICFSDLNKYTLTDITRKSKKLC